MNRIFASIFFIILSIYCFPQEYKLTDIIIKGNYQTNDDIIFRELPISIGDTIAIEDIDILLQTSEINLLNTSLFNFADISYSFSSNNTLIVSISVLERWYYWAYPILEQADRTISSFLYHQNWDKYNYGIAFDRHNFLGKNHLLRLKLRRGFREHYAFSYIAPEVDRQKKHGFWFSADYFRQKQVLANIVKTNPFYFQTNDNQYIYDNYRFEAGYSYRPQLHYVVKFRLVRDYYSYSNELAYISDGWSTEYNIRHYYFPQLKFKFDNRNNRYYPTDGYYFHVSGKISDISNEFENIFWVSDINFQKHLSIWEELFFYSGEISLSLSDGFNSKTLMPFYYQNYHKRSNFIRGYDYYYNYADFFTSFQQTINYLIVPYREYNIPFIKNDQFGRIYTRLYANAFFDLAYSSSFNSQYNDVYMQNEILWSTGMGFALETYYDRVFKINLTYNSFFNNFGIFVNYKTTILNAF